MFLIKEIPVKSEYLHHLGVQHYEIIVIIIIHGFIKYHVLYNMDFSTQNISITKKSVGAHIYMEVVYKLPEIKFLFNTIRIYTCF